MKDVGKTVPIRQVLRISDGRMISMQDTCPEDIRTALLKHVKDVYWPRWAKKTAIEELKEGVWFAPIKSHVDNKG